MEIKHNGVDHITNKNLISKFIFIQKLQNVKTLVLEKIVPLYTQNVTMNPLLYVPIKALKKTI